MRVTALKLRDRDFSDQWNREVEDRWEYSDFLNSPGWRKDWISFDCVCHDPATDTIFCGITSFDADIFWGWSRREKKWVDCGYGRVRDRYDAKFHRSLLRDSRDGCLYATQALLHDVDRFWEAPGASIVRYSPGTKEIAKLGIPMPHLYIQSLILDESRDMLYGQTFTPENLVSFNIRTRESRWLGPISSGMTMAQGENLCLDDRGGVWGVWAVTRAWQSHSGADTYRLFRFDPAKGRIEYLDKGLLHPDGSYGYVKPEAFFNFGTGTLFASGGSGALYRLDPAGGDAQFLFQAIGSEGGRRSRLASMCLSPEGLAYGVTGRDGNCELLQFNPKSGAWKLLGPLRDSATGTTPWQVHDICAAPDGMLYAGENDHPARSGFLWEIRL